MLSHFDCIIQPFTILIRPMSKPTTFATPLPQSRRSSVLEWRFPKPHHSYVLTGKSWAAWHTSFVIPQLNLLLDAGLCVNNLRPKHIFITHGHSDHSLLSPAFVKRDDPPDIFCPLLMTAALDNFVQAKTVLNYGGHIPDPNAAAGIRPTHVTHGLQPGDVVPLRRIKGDGNSVTATAFACHHSVPCLGYVFRKTTRKLRAQYAKLAGPEIKALRESGIEITEPVTAPIFAFLGDTTAQTLAAGPSWLDDLPVVITECSFLYPEHRAQADKTKHTIWEDLEPVIRKRPETTFVLTHFSMRYTEDQVRIFFRDMADPPQNMVVWVDGDPEVEGPRGSEQCFTR
ncbi:beta-lactamase-like protein [Podospora didyma]|uniref:Beta-lactamase-like protein n=1 Tax=Podospora didyma TaxID=330526 RepID=A0AAE0KEU5_9PEZI|nr:beta-lactamase-like protein [Podospora didyma]